MGASGIQGQRAVLTARRHWPWISLLVLACWVGPPARISGDEDRPPQVSPRPGQGLGTAATLAPALRGRADRARRGGRFAEALRLYGQLERLRDARDADRMHARVWSARMRLERGEPSALLDVETLIDVGMDPAATARFVLALRRIRGRRAFGISDEELATLEGKCIASLARRSRTDDENGARASRWLGRLTVGRSTGA